MTSRTGTATGSTFSTVSRFSTVSLVLPTTEGEARVVLGTLIEPVAEAMLTVEFDGDVVLRPGEPVVVVLHHGGSIEDDEVLLAIALASDDDPGAPPADIAPRHLQRLRVVEQRS